MGQKLSTVVGPFTTEFPNGTIPSIESILKKKNQLSRYTLSNATITWGYFKHGHTVANPKVALPSPLVSTLYVLPGTIIYDGATETNTPKEFLMYGYELDSIAINKTDSPPTVSIYSEG